MAGKYEYTSEMEERLHEVARDGLTEEKIEDLCAEFDFPRRSVTAKLRKLDYDVPKKVVESAFNDDETEELRSVLEASGGDMSAEEIANKVADGKFTPSQIRGKALALKMTDCIKKAEKKVKPKTYTDEEEATVRQMAEGGSYIEEIADAVGKSVASVRGKLLSLKISAPTRDKKASSVSYEGIEEIAGDKTVAELAEHYGKTERGVKTVLSRRAIACSDYTPKSVSSDE